MIIRNPIIILNLDDLRLVRYGSIDHARDMVKNLWSWLSKEEVELISKILVKSYRRR